MKINKKLIIIILYLVNISFFIIGCSAGKYGKGPDAHSETKPAQLNENEEYQLGDKVPGISPIPGDDRNIGVEYVINKVDIYDKPEDAALRLEQLNLDADYFDLTGTPAVAELDQSNVLVSSLQITNRNEDINDLNITALSLVYLRPETKDFVTLGDSIYFAGSKADSTDDSKYYAYELPKGKSLDTKVAWLIPAEGCKYENLYLCSNFEGDDEYRKFIKLNIKKGN